MIGPSRESIVDTETAATFAEVKQQVAGAEELARRQAEKRKALLDAEFRLQTIEIQLRQATAEVTRLEGFSLSSLLGALSGTKTAQLSGARQSLADLEAQYDALAGTVDSLRSEVERLEGDADRADEARRQWAQLCDAKAAEIESRGGAAADTMRRLDAELAEARSSVKRLKRAMEAGDEARRGLLDEIESLSTLGRCRVSEGHRLISTFINHALKSTIDQCAGRVRQQVRRFAHRYREAIGQEADRELTDILAALEGVGRDFSRDWFYADSDMNNSSGFVVGLLVTANMHLEKQLNAAGQRLADLESQRRSLIESA